MGEQEHPDRRLGDRVETDIGIMCRIPAMPGSARIIDLTHRGCKVELSKRAGAEKGATILLDIPNGENIQGQVMWVKRNVAGVRFSRALASSTAVFLGIEEAPEVQVVINPAPEYEKPGLLHHWFRRISKIF